MGEVSFWDVPQRKLVRTVKATNASLHALAVDGQGRRLAVAGRDSGLALFDLVAGTGPVPELTRANSEFITARIYATAQGPGNSEVGRAAIVRIGTFAARGYSLLAWGTGAE